jgi:hypothetical protein
MSQAPYPRNKSSRPKGDTASRLYSLLVDNPYDWIQKPPETDTWHTVKHGKLNPHNLTKGHPVGIRPGKKQCRWAAIDIDKTSCYHPSQAPEAIEEIVKILRQNGAEAAILIQSSKSNGIHIFIPIPEHPTAAISAWLESILTKKNLMIKDGQLEIFPNRRKTGLYKALRMPLIAPDSWVLNDDLAPIHRDQARFCDEWENALDCNQEFKINGNKPEEPNWIQEHRERLRVGFTGRGQTQEVSRAAAIIAAKDGGLYGIALQRRMCKLVSEAPGYRAYCGHQKEIDRGSFSCWVKHYSKFGCNCRASNTSRQERKTPKATNPVHNSQLSASRRRLVAFTATRLLKEGRTFPNITAARHAIRSELKAKGDGVSPKTIRKHDDLIQPLIKR